MKKWSLGPTVLVPLGEDRQNDTTSRRPLVVDIWVLLCLLMAQYSTSRRWLDETGLISEWRFGWALGLLRYAGLEQAHPDSLEALQAAVDSLNAATLRLRTSGTPRLHELRAKAGKRYRLNRYS